WPLTDNCRKQGHKKKTKKNFPALVFSKKLVIMLVQIIKINIIVPDTIIDKRPQNQTKYCIVSINTTVIIVVTIAVFFFVSSVTLKKSDIGFFHRKNTNALLKIISPKKTAVLP